MSEQRLEVADVFRRYGQKFLDCWGHVLSRQQRKAFRDIGACRTAALGTHLRVWSKNSICLNPIMLRAERIIQGPAFRDGSNTTLHGPTFDA